MHLRRSEADYEAAERVLSQRRDVRLSEEAEGALGNQVAQGGMRELERQQQLDRVRTRPG